MTEVVKRIAQRHPLHGVRGGMMVIVGLIAVAILVMIAEAVLTLDFVRQDVPAATRLLARMDIALAILAYAVGYAAVARSRLFPPLFYVFSAATVLLLAGTTYAASVGLTGRDISAFQIVCGLVVLGLPYVATSRRVAITYRHDLTPEEMAEVDSYPAARFESLWPRGDSAATEAAEEHGARTAATFDAMPVDADAQAADAAAPTAADATAATDGRWADASAADTSDSGAAAPAPAASAAPQEPPHPAGPPPARPPASRKDPTIPFFRRRRDPAAGPQTQPEPDPAAETAAAPEDGRQDDIRAVMAAVRAAARAAAPWSPLPPERADTAADGAQRPDPQPVTPTDPIPTPDRPSSSPDETGDAGAVTGGGGKTGDTAAAPVAPPIPEAAPEEPIPPPPRLAPRPAAHDEPAPVDPFEAEFFTVPPDDPPEPRHHAPAAALPPTAERTGAAAPAAAASPPARVDTSAGASDPFEADFFADTSPADRSGADTPAADAPSAADAGADDGAETGPTEPPSDTPAMTVEAPPTRRPPGGSASPFDVELFAAEPDPATGRPQAAPPARSAAIPPAAPLKPPEAAAQRPQPAPQRRTVSGRPVDPFDADLFEEPEIPPGADSADRAVTGRADAAPAPTPPPKPAAPPPGPPPRAASVPPRAAARSGGMPPPRPAKGRPAVDDPFSSEGVFQQPPPATPRAERPSTAADRVRSGGQPADIDDRILKLRQLAGIGSSAARRADNRSFYDPQGSTTRIDYDSAPAAPRRPADTPGPAASASPPAPGASSATSATAPSASTGDAGTATSGSAQTDSPSAAAEASQTVKDARGAAKKTAGAAAAIAGAATAAASKGAQGSDAMARLLNNPMLTRGRRT